MQLRQLDGEMFVPSSCRSQFSSIRFFFVIPLLPEKCGLLCILEEAFIFVTLYTEKLLRLRWKCCLWFHCFEEIIFCTFAHGLYSYRIIRVYIEHQSKLSTITHWRKKITSRIIILNVVHMFSYGIRSELSHLFRE